MTDLDARIHFIHTYYDLARKYRIYTKCVKNIQLERMCVTSAIDCGLQGLQLKNVELVSEEDKQYFLSMGDHLVEVIIILAKRNYEKEKREKKEDSK